MNKETKNDHLTFKLTQLFINQKSKTIEHKCSEGECGGDGCQLNN